MNKILIAVLTTVTAPTLADEVPLWLEGCKNPKSVYIKREICGRTLFQGKNEVLGHLDGQLRQLHTGVYRFATPMCEFTIQGNKVTANKSGDAWILDQ